MGDSVFTPEDARRIMAAQPDVAFDAARIEIDRDLLRAARSNTWPMTYTLGMIQIRDWGPGNSSRWISASLVDQSGERLADAYRAAGWRCVIAPSPDDDVPNGTRCLEFQAPDPEGQR